MTLIGSLGLASFYLNKDKLHVVYTGNMGNNINHVKDCCQKFYGFDPYKKWKLIEEKGSPDYQYEAIFELN